MWVAGLALAVALPHVACAATGDVIQLQTMFPLTAGDNAEGVVAKLGVQAAFSFADKWLPGQKVALTVTDDQSDPRRGVKGVADAINKAGSVGLLGALNSAVSLGANLVASEMGVMHASCCSSSPALSQKSLYPTFVRTIPADAYESAMLAKFMKSYGWSSVATISTDDAFGAGSLAAFRNATQQLNMTILASGVLPTTNANMNTASAVQAELQKIKDAKGRIIAIFATAKDAQPILETAYAMGMLGNPKYMFFGGNGLGDTLLSNWAFAVQHPEALVGLTTISGGACQPETQQYSMLTSYLSTALGTKPGKELDMFMCLAWDSAVLMLQALNSTYSLIDGINAEYNATISGRCLQAPVYNAFGTVNASCVLPQAIADKMWSDAQCDTTCVRCGVCSLMQLENGLYRRSPQALFLQELYRTQFVGSTGHVSLDQNGDRSVAGAPFVIRNVQQQASSAGRRRQSSQPAQFVRVGTITQSSSDSQDTSIAFLADTKLMFMGGATSPPLDADPSEPFERPVALLSIMGVAVSLGIVLSIALGAAFYRYQNLLVMKTSSPPFMYLLLCGAVLMYASVLLLIPQPTPQLCTANVWLYVLGFFLAFSAVFMKTYRINYLFSPKTATQRRVLDDRQLLLWLLGLMVVVIVYLSVWTGVAPPFVTTLVNVDNQVEAKCSRNWWNFSILIAELVLVLWGVVLCIRVHKVPLFFNESKWIAITVYNWLFVFGMSEVLLITIAQINPTASFAIQSVAIFFAVTCMLLLFFIPKFYIVYNGDGNRREYTSTHRAAFSGEQPSKDGPTKKEKEMNVEELRRELDHAIKENARLYTLVRTVGNVHVEPLDPASTIGTQLEKKSGDVYYAPLSESITDRDDAQGGACTGEGSSVAAGRGSHAAQADQLSSSGPNLSKEQSAKGSAVYDAHAVITLLSPSGSV